MILVIRKVFADYTDQDEGKLSSHSLPLPQRKGDVVNALWSWHETRQCCFWALCSLLWPIQGVLGAWLAGTVRHHTSHTDHLVISNENTALLAQEKHTCHQRSYFSKHNYSLSNLEQKASRFSIKVLVLKTQTTNQQNHHHQPTKLNISSRLLCKWKQHKGVNLQASITSNTSTLQ